MRGGGVKKGQTNSDVLYGRPLMIPILDSSPLLQFSKFKNFLWVCWFLGKNISKFVPLTWKLDIVYSIIPGSALKVFLITDNLEVLQRTKYWIENYRKPALCRQKLCHQFSKSRWFQECTEHENWTNVLDQLPKIQFLSFFHFYLHSFYKMNIY